MLLMRSFKLVARLPFRSSRILQSQKAFFLFTFFSNLPPIGPLPSINEFGKDGGGGRLFSALLLWSVISTNTVVS
eukprot:gene32121-42874_t